MATASETQELTHAPSIVPLYLRAAASVIPGASRLPFVPGSGRDLPSRDVVLPSVTIDRGALADYNRVCGFPLRDTLPATYLHNLAFPLHMVLLSASDFPFSAIGLVHLENRITQHRPVAADEAVSLTVGTTGLRPHAKGRAFDVVARGRVGRTVVWEGVSTYLRLGQGNPEAKAGARAAAASPGDTADPPVSAVWELDGGLGRRFASVSGDRNPIHLHAWTAKPLGFSTAIAHGMWTKARCLAALDPVLPEAFSVAVQFRRPVALPSKVTFGSTVNTDETIGFAVRNARKGTPHLDGVVTPVKRKKR